MKLSACSSIIQSGGKRRAWAWSDVAPRPMRLVAGVPRAMPKREAKPVRSLYVTGEHLAARGADSRPVALQAAEDSEDIRLSVILH